MKVAMTGPSLRVILAASAAVFAVGCGTPLADNLGFGKKNKSDDTPGTPVAVAPIVATPGNNTAGNQVPVTRAAPAPTPEAKLVPVAPAPAALQVVISNKAETTLATTPAALTLTFDVSGRGTSDALSNYTFQCKLNGDTAFKDCTGATYFTFLGMTNKTQYNLTVQATNKATSAVIGSDSVSFTAAGLAEAPATGEGNGNGAGNGGGNGPGTGGDGKKPVDQPVVVPMIPLNFLIGSRLMYTVPTDSHVTEYVSTLNYKASLVAYQIAAQDDLAYIGNSSCNRNADRSIKSSDSAKNVYNYCQTTILSDGQYTGLPYYAPNHIETNTNADLVLAGKETHVDVNVYDYHQGFFRNRSQFWNLCQHRTVVVTPTIPVMRNFFGWPTVMSQIAVCRTNLAPAFSLGQVADGSFNQNEYFVASFIAHVDETNNLIASVPCHIGGYDECEKKVFLASSSYSALVEVTVVGKVGTSGKNENDFAREQMAASLTNFSILH
jgi:hypothetical protein